MPNRKFTKTLSSAVARLLRPLVRILLRNGVPYGVFEDIARWVYADVALREFSIAGRKQSVSRAAVITGLSRKEITRLQELGAPYDDAAEERYNRAARVISGWVREARFADKQGNPADLPLSGEGATFEGLVKEFSRDVPARAMLDELVRVGTVERLDDDRIRLLNRAYLPQTDDIARLEILGTDVRLLIATIDHNLRHTADERLFQRKVAYDNLPENILPQLRALSATRAQALLEELDRYLAGHDRDVNPSASGTGRKNAGVGIYYFEEDFDASSEGELK
ncbi:MAG: DUF6502 family protein [Gammaproteobacteria bacterium]